MGRIKRLANKGTQAGKNLLRKTSAAAKKIRKLPPKIPWVRWHRIPRTVEDVSKIRRTKQDLEIFLKDIWVEESIKGKEALTERIRLRLLNKFMMEMNPKAFPMEINEFNFKAFKRTAKGGMLVKYAFERIQHISSELLEEKKQLEKELLEAQKARKETKRKGFMRSKEERQKINADAVKYREKIRQDLLDAVIGWQTSIIFLNILKGKNANAAMAAIERQLATGQKKKFSENNK